MDSQFFTSKKGSVKIMHILIFINSVLLFLGNINCKLSNSFFLSITKLGFMPTLLVITVLAIILPLLSTIPDLNSDLISLF